MTAELLGTSLAAGLVCGFVVCVPIGPVNLTVINQALHKGFGPAFLLGAGAICADAIYVTLVLAGHTSILDKPQVVLAMRAVAMVAITALGLRYIFLKPEKLIASGVKAKQVDERWHHPRAFLLGFILTMSNLTLFVLWAMLATVLFDREWVAAEGGSRAVCVLGVMAGGLLWFFLLAFFVSRAHRQIKPTTLTVLARVSGVVLLVFAGLLAFKLIKR